MKNIFQLFQGNFKEPNKYFYLKVLGRTKQNKSLTESIAYLYRSVYEFKSEAWIC